MKLEVHLLLAWLAVGSAFAQVKPEPPQNVTAPQIAIEMRVIAAPEETMGIFTEAKTADPPPMISPEKFRAGLQKLELMKEVELLSAPKVTTRSGQHATVEIEAAKDQPKSSAMKFDVLPVLAPDGRIEIVFTYTNECPKDGNIQTRVLKANASLQPGHTLLIGGAGEETGRITLVTVTASVSGPSWLPPSKPDHPSGKRIPGKPGFVTSPYAPGGAIDVRGFSPGTEVKDPHTGKIFLVPSDVPATGSAPAPEKSPRVSVAGKILAVNPDWNFVVLNIGNNARLEAGHEMVVTRNGQSVGKVRVMAVEEKTSIADIVRHSVPRGESLQPGDQVSSDGGTTDKPSPAKPAQPSPVPAGKTPLEKAKTIIIPHLALKDAKLSEVVEFLTKKSKQLDPEKTGVTLVLDRSQELGATRITLDLKNVPLGVALKYITDLAGTGLREEENTIVIGPEKR